MPAPTQAGTARPGTFVTFEGIDGSGKSSTLAKVATALQAEGLPIQATKEETESPRGAWIKQSIRDGWDPLATTLLFVADRAVHVRDIAAWRAAGKHVLCDRYLHSTLAYQSVTLAGKLPDPLGYLRGLHEGWCPLPDHVLLFKADPAKCVARVAKRGATAPYEKAAFLGKVQDAYLALAAADPKRFHVIDAERDVSVLAEDALAVVRRWLR